MLALITREFSGLWLPTDVTLKTFNIKAQRGAHSFLVKWCQTNKQQLQFKLLHKLHEYIFFLVGKPTDAQTCIRSQCKDKSDWTLYEVVFDMGSLERGL